MNRKIKLLLCVTIVTAILTVLSGCQYIDYISNPTKIIDWFKNTGPTNTNVESSIVETESTNNNTDPTTEPVTEPPTEPQETIPPEFNITLSFVGDCMLASNHDKTTENNFNGYVNKKESSYFLEKVKPIFEDDDFTIVNLENVFTNQKLTEREKKGDRNFWYKSKTSNVNILTCSSVEGVSLANNHVNDYGSKGKDDTIKTVTDAGLEYGYKDHIMYFEKEGFRIAVICEGLWSKWQADDIVKLIKIAEEQSDYQIVFYHGGTEKIHKPEDWKISASRKLVDNGADLVIGNHPHVLQPREIYNGVEIIYSLGNFCYGGHSQPENRTIIYQMNLLIDKETLTIKNNDSKIIPCYIYTSTYNNYQPAVIENEEEIKKVLDFMDWLVDSPI